LPPGLVVVDESSMLDLVLARALFRALTPAHRLVLVGDADQLPSVGPGNVLSDIMVAAESGHRPIAVVRLSEVFRQAQGSSIVANAHRVLHGEDLLSDPVGESGEFFVVSARDAAHAHDLVVRLATERVPKAYGFDGRDEVQVLCPMHKGLAGTEALNRALQDHHTAGHREIEARSAAGQLARRFRVGDRVMQTRNDYEKAVFNGDMGTIASIDLDARKVVVDVDGERVEYHGNELTALQLAYAVSIHKSQGSEFPAVVVVILPEHHVMLRRNLLYTAMTRARSLCVVVGDPRAIHRAIVRADTGRRFTALARRLTAALGEHVVAAESDQ
jgi:exodeoxyribonuclease V alpha subunit